MSAFSMKANMASVPPSRGSVMEEAARTYGSVGSERSPEKVPKSSSGFRGTKVSKRIDECYAAEGLTPEEVNEIRYSGIRLDMSVDPVIVEDPNPTDQGKRSDLHFRLANDAASKALGVYKILLQHEIRERILKHGTKFDDIGVEVFAVMHMMKAFLGKRADFAPVELTIVRLRLSTGVEKTTDKKSPCHFFPSPLPMPLGKGGDYRAAQREWHEIDEDDFEHFEDDFIYIFYNIMACLDPRSVRSLGSVRSVRSLGSLGSVGSVGSVDSVGSVGSVALMNGLNFGMKVPLVICRSHNVQQNIMMFEYLHQRALLAQRVGVATKAPDGFKVPEKIPLAFCELRAFDTAVRAALRELQLTVETMTETPNVGNCNSCFFHKNTNKMECTTFVVSEIVENLLVFSPFWGLATPTRFVEPFDFHSRVDFVEPIQMAPCTAARHQSQMGGVMWNDKVQIIHKRMEKLQPSIDTRSDRGSDDDSGLQAQAARFAIQPAVRLPNRSSWSPNIRGLDGFSSDVTGTSSGQFEGGTAGQLRHVPGYGRGTARFRIPDMTAAGAAGRADSAMTITEAVPRADLDMSVVGAAARADPTVVPVASEPLSVGSIGSSLTDHTTPSPTFLSSDGFEWKTQRPGRFEGRDINRVPLRTAGGLRTVGQVEPNAGK